MFIVITIILIVELGYSALPGIGFLLVALPMQTIFMKRLFALRMKSMEWTDKRAKLLQEILGGMRIVKFMAWEIPFLERLGAIREMELSYVRRLLTMRSAMMAFAMSLPVLAAILSFVTYKLTSHDLRAATIFSVVTLFQLMRMPLMIWPMSLSATADALNAIRRLEVVFEAETLTEGRLIDPSMEEAVRIDNASFTWDAAPVADDNLQKKLDHKQAKANGTAVSSPKKKRKARLFKWNKKSKKITVAEQAMVDINGGAAGPSGGEAVNGSMAGGVPPLEPGANIEEEEEVADRVFHIEDIDLAIPRGSLTAIVGPIGSGKSSLLQGLMGEMRRTEGKVTFSGSTALCAQTPWIQNATVREVSLT
jgi:ABC-type multidrug transport system fused ATPase/permease subunit